MDEGDRLNTRLQHFWTNQPGTISVVFSGKKEIIQTIVVRGGRNSIFNHRGDENVFCFFFIFCYIEGLNCCMYFSAVMYYFVQYYALAFCLGKRHICICCIFSPIICVCFIFYDDILYDSFFPLGRCSTPVDGTRSGGGAKQTA